MSQLPAVVLEAWERRVLAPVVTTVSKNGVPNSIYATCVSFYNNEKVLVADNKFVKTYKNLEEGCKGCLVFLTEDKKAYQIKGTFTYATKGAYFDDMKKWNGEGLAGNGVAIMSVEEIYSGSEQIAF